MSPHIILTYILIARSSLRKEELEPSSKRRKTEDGSAAPGQRRPNAVKSAAQKAPATSKPLQGPRPAPRPLVAPRVPRGSVKAKFVPPKVRPTGPPKATATSKPLQPSDRPPAHVLAYYGQPHQPADKPPQRCLVKGQVNPPPAPLCPPPPPPRHPKHTPPKPPAPVPTPPPPPKPPAPVPTPIVVEVPSQTSAPPPPPPPLDGGASQVCPAAAGGSSQVWITKTGQRVNIDDLQRRAVACMCLMRWLTRLFNYCHSL
jgi:hypothetical protein